MVTLTPCAPVQSSPLTEKLLLAPCSAVPGQPAGHTLARNFDASSTFSPVGKTKAVEVLDLMERPLSLVLQLQRIPVVEPKICSTDCAVPALPSCAL